MTGPFPISDSVPLKVRFVRDAGWLRENLTDLWVPDLPVHKTIEKIADETNRVGSRPLWEGYQKIAGYPRSTTKARQPDQVRVNQEVGRFFSWLAGNRAAPQIVEIGTAFGISGMYWLAGIGQGHLFTFDPNPDWTALARDNLNSISDRFTLTVDTFENAAPSLVPHRAIDIAFIDGIHMPDVVHRQLELIRPMMKPHGLILFDDIGFSDAMKGFWNEIACSSDAVASATIGRRIGIIELA
ncbi:MAG: class I SAM-dependent methyltransferase [Alphaproteobacteria bacterium]|nr:class I SAM-dependent methyltransferase [Alphaproteobacteria bacterium]